LSNGCAFVIRFAAARLTAILVGISLGAGSSPAGAADALRMTAEASSVYDWSGLYFGSHVGYGAGSGRASVQEASAPTTVSNLHRLGGLYGGLHIGFNYVRPSHILLGGEADISFPNYLGADDVVTQATSTLGRLEGRLDFVGTLRARAGYAHNNWLVYGTGGLAFAQGRFLRFFPGSNEPDDASKILRLRSGWAAGGGFEVGIERDWTARLEYLYTRFSTTGTELPSAVRYESAWDLHILRLGLNRRIDSQAAKPAEAEAFGSLAMTGFGSWELHGQTTYIQQGYPSFRSPYYGANSFTPWAQTRETWTISAFLGVRLWEGGEFYFNPELLQGFGLHNTTGAAGFPNGEAQKSNFAWPHYNTSRLFVRQTFGLGGAKENIEGDYGQLSSKPDISRVTFQIGKFAVHDLFDSNSYSSDPRVHFLNWSIWAAGAFDYSADRVGLTYGAAMELNQKGWALRAGYFLMGSVPNGDNFDMALLKRGGYVMEFEKRYAIFSRPGKFRILGFVNSSRSGSYRDALDLVAMNPGLDCTDAIIRIRKGRLKYGYVLNFEQSVSDDVGVFGRWSWNDGRNEIMAFTDIDSSLSGGAVIMGTRWGRPQDKIGIAGAINGLSKDHRDYIAAGGLGILIGDGRLNYREEKILEAYYALSAGKGRTITFDYQYFVNPAHNADRGPISIFAGRLHAEF
jgi:high affinity Mn2+ porin